MELADVLWGNLEDLEGSLRARREPASDFDRHAQRDAGAIARARLRETLGMNVGTDVQPARTLAGSRQTRTGDVNEAVARVAATAERDAAGPL